MGDPSASDNAFQYAARRWEAIITGDQPDINSTLGTLPSDWFRGVFDQPYAGPVDDLVIGYEITDLPGNTIGRAGCLYVINGPTGSPYKRCISGRMSFDRDFFARNTEADAYLIAIHEIGHILGVITTGCESSCRNGESFDYGAGLNSTYCTAATQQYQSIFSTTGSIPLEDVPLSGSKCAHWEEDIFQTSTETEIMTWQFDKDLKQLLTAVTIGSLEDTGAYTGLDYTQADVYTSLGNLRQNSSAWETYAPSRDFDLETCFD